MKRSAVSLDFPRFAVILSVLAFGVLLVAFGLTVLSFRADVERWARRDLKLRAELTSENLREPLATQDFRRIGEIARRLEDDHGLSLTVYSPRGGIFFRRTADARADIRESAASDGYRVELGRNTVFLPFHEALAGFALAALLGILSMVVVFFALYRQRVRIRELARLEKFRRDFIADFSHELKTPLTGILGAVDLMDGASPLVPLVRKEARRLTALATEMLDLAKLERVSGLQPTLEPVEVRAVLDEVRTRFAAEAAAGGLVLASSPPAAVGIVRTDRELLVRALSNLVSNAIRHSGGTRITLGVSCQACQVTISVADDGRGIPPRERTRIFERFYRLDAARSEPGTGLGLAIARSIARLLGGDLVFESVSPHGSNFLLSLTLH